MPGLDLEGNQVTGRWGEPYYPPATYPYYPPATYPYDPLQRINPPTYSPNPPQYVNPPGNNRNIEIDRLRRIERSDQGPGSRDWGNIDPTTGRPRIEAINQGPPREIYGWDPTPGGRNVWADPRTRRPDVQLGIEPEPLPRESRYMNYAMSQKGWNPEWNRYGHILTDYLKGDRKDVTEPQPTPIPYGGRRSPTHIPQADWQAIAEFAKDLEPMSGEGWENKNPIGVIQPWPGPPRPWPPRRPPTGRWEGSIEDKYMNYIGSQRGWKPEWNRYVPMLTEYLRAPNIDVTERRASLGGGGIEAIPQETWSDIAKWYEGNIMGAPGKRGGMLDFDMFKRRSSEPPPDPISYPPVDWAPRPQLIDPYNYRDPSGDYYRDQRELLKKQGTLQDLANKNAARRMVLARMMNKPRGMNSLMR